MDFAYTLMISKTRIRSITKSTEKISCWKHNFFWSG